jgi:hypothetical protein
MKKQTTAFATLFLLGGFLASCSESQTKSDAASGDADHDSDASGNPGQTPILERPASGSYVCSVSRDATSHAPKTWTGLSALQVVAGGAAFLARAEWEMINYYAGHRSFVFSTIGLDGTLGAPTTIPVDNADAVKGLAAAPQGSGFVLVWVDDAGLHFAAFDGQGVLVGQPSLITTLDRDRLDPVRTRMAAGPSGSGFALVLSIVRNGVALPYALFLDATGAPRGSLRPLRVDPSSPSAYYDSAPDVLATQDGYALVWSELEPKSGRIYFSKTDALGNQTVAPTIVTSATGDRPSLNGSGFAGGGMRIIEGAGGFIAAWTESYNGYTEDGGWSPTKGAWSVVRLARLDSQGVPTGTTATMRAPENDVDEVEPVLTPFGDALAVAWGRGSHIYICGGCVPDQRIDFALIDPTSLSPLSNVVTVTNGGGDSGGGLLRKQIALTGSSFLTLYDRTFHTSAEPGSAVFSCTR